MNAKIMLMIPLGEMNAGFPDNSLPGGQGGHPWFPGHRPDRPDNDLPGGGHVSGQPIPLPPDQPWPPGVNPPIVPPNPPPDSIWPPLPPGTATKKALVLVYISGYGQRHIVVDVPEPKY